MKIVDKLANLQIDSTGPKPDLRKLTKSGRNKFNIPQIIKVVTSDTKAKKHTTTTVSRVVQLSPSMISSFENIKKNSGKSDKDLWKEAIELLHIKYSIEL